MDQLITHEPGGFRGALPRSPVVLLGGPFCGQYHGDLALSETFIVRNAATAPSVGPQRYYRTGLVDHTSGPEPAVIYGHESLDDAALWGAPDADEADADE